MNRMNRSFATLALLAALVHAPGAVAATCTAVNGAQNWNNPGAWTGCAGGNGIPANTPGPGDIAIKNNNGALTVNPVAGVSVGELRLGNGSITQTQALTVGAGGIQITGGSFNSNNTLSVTGPTTISGGAMNLSTAASAASKTFTGAVTITGTGAWSNTNNRPVTFHGGLSHSGGTFNNGTGTATFSTASPFTLGGSSAMTFGGQVTLTTGVTRTNSNTVTINGLLDGTGVTWSNDAGTLAYNNTGAATEPMASGTLDANVAANTVSYGRGGAQTVKAAAYSNLTLATSGVKTMTGVTTINGNLNILNTATMTGNDGFTVTGRLTHSSTGTTTLTAATPITVGQWTHSAGVINAAGNTITVTGTGATTWTKTTASAFSNAGTVDFTGASPQITGGAGQLNFNNLKISVSTLATLLVSAAITGDVEVASGTLNLGAFTVNRAVGTGTFTVADGATLRIGGGNSFPTGYASPHTLGATSTVQYDGAAQTVFGEPSPGYGHLTIAGTNTKTMPAVDLAIRGNFTLTGGTATAASNLTIGGDYSQSGGIFNAATFTHKVAGNFTRSAGTFNDNTSTFDFNGTAAQAITGTVTFNHLTISNTAAAVTPNLTVSVNGNIANAGTLGGLIQFTGGGATHQLSGSGAFNNLTLNDTQGVLITSGNPRVDGTLNFAANCLVTTGMNSLIIGSAGSVTGASNARHVVGNLGRQFSAAGSYTYNLGTGTTLTPVVIDFTDLTAGGIVTVGGPKAGDHPDTTAVTSSVDPAQSINRYWTIKKSAALEGTHNVTFNYLTGDADTIPPVTVASMVIARGAVCSGTGASRSCSNTWKRYAPSPAPTGTQATTTGIVLFATSGDVESDFAVGETGLTRFTREKEFVFTRERY